jgi:hypothetical protein
MFTINGPGFGVMCFFLLKTDLGLSDIHRSQRHRRSVMIKTKYAGKK